MAAATFNTGLDGLKLVEKDSFSNMERSESTLYIVTSSSDFTLYLGDKPLQSTGGVMAAAESVISAGTSGIIGYEEVSA